MVKLRSGTVYIDTLGLDNLIDKYNGLLKTIIFKYSKWLLSQEESGNAIHNLDNTNNDIIAAINILNKKYTNIRKDYLNIKNLDKSLKLYKGPKAGTFYIYRKKKHYVKKCNNNYFKRKLLYEDLWMLLLQFIKNYKNVDYVNYINAIDKHCLICYLKFDKKDKVLVCKDINSEHLYHKKCFSDNLKYVDVPFIYKTEFHTHKTIKLYECQYCRKKKVNIRKIYHVK